MVGFNLSLSPFILGLIQSGGQMVAHDLNILSLSCLTEFPELEVAVAFRLADDLSVLLFSEGSRSTITICCCPGSIFGFSAADFSLDLDFFLPDFLDFLGDELFLLFLVFLMCIW